MDDRRSERSLALGRHRVRGAARVIAALLPGSPPKPDDSAAKIAKFVVDKGDEIRWAGFIGVLGSIVLLGWLGAVWRLHAPRRGRRADARGGGDRAARCSRSPLVNVGAVLLSVMAIVGPQALGASQTRILLPAHEQPRSPPAAIGLGLFIGAFVDRDHPDRRAAARAGMDRRADRARLPRDGRRDRVDARRLLLPRLRRLPGVLALDLVVSVMMYRAPSARRRRAGLNGVARPRRASRGRGTPPGARPRRR